MEENVKLDRSDWEDAKRQAEQILKQTEISRIVNENLLKITIEALSKFPKIPTNEKLNNKKL